MWPLGPPYRRERLQSWVSCIAGWFSTIWATREVSSESVSSSVVSDSLQPHGLWLARLLCRGILQARILEWVAIPFFRGSSQPRDQIQVSCIAGTFFTIWATREVYKQKFCAKCLPVQDSCENTPGAGKPLTDPSWSWAAGLGGGSHIGQREREDPGWLHILGDDGPLAKLGHLGEEAGLPQRATPFLVKQAGTFPLFT